MIFDASFGTLFKYLNAQGFVFFMTTLSEFDELISH
jgi:hypothetical protein